MCCQGRTKPAFTGGEGPRTNSLSNAHKNDRFTRCSCTPACPTSTPVTALLPIRDKRNLFLRTWTVTEIYRLLCNSYDSRMTRQNRWNFVDISVTSLPATDTKLKGGLNNGPGIYYSPGVRLLQTQTIII